ncbi:MAG: cytochrome c4 [Betaproteobacteria bacterium]|nr:cytochrome c4 [Betaproteobacteria bacterium]
MNYCLAVATIVGALASSPSYGQGVAGIGPAKARQTASNVCGACHGSDGNSTQAVNPSLAGQHADYTYKQLMNFKSQGGKPAERSNPVMAGMVAGLTEEDMRSLAAYFEMQEPKPRSARDPDLVRLGRAIYRGGIMSKRVAACAGCHSPNGAGIPAQFPRLASQHAGYVESQLRAFRAGERANDPNKMMRTVAAKLDDREIKAVAEYIAGLR